MDFPITTPFTGASSIPKHPREHDSEDGGISLKAEDNDGFWPVVKDFAKKIGGKVLSGKFNFSTMQRPSRLSLPISHLQLIANEFACIVKYVDLAVEAASPLDKMKLITAGIVGNLSLNIYTSKGKGPCNPTLGETLHVNLQGEIAQRRRGLFGTDLDDSPYDPGVRGGARREIHVFVQNQSGVISSRCRWEPR